ncbi:hypothetical protein GCK32_018378, partial [Trichostrongylus colubriformis]
MKHFQELNDGGIRKDDPRLASVIRQVRDAEHIDHGVFDQEHLYLDSEAFKECVGSSITVIGKALKKQLVIPDWPSFTAVISELHDFCRQFKGGQVATYIPQLARADPESFAISVCTVDGQRKSWGDALKPF